MDTTIISTPLFPGDIAPTIKSYVERYKFYARKTVENIILMAETVYEAELRLKPDEFNNFCLEVNMDPKGSTYRKMRQIGKLKDRFLPHLDNMPNNWTTVYQLSTIQDREFKNLIDNKVLNPEVTPEQIKQGSKPSNDNTNTVTKAESIKFVLSLEATNAKEAFQMEQALRQLGIKYNKKIGISDKMLWERWEYEFLQDQKAA